MVYPICKDENHRWLSIISNTRKCKNLNFDWGSIPNVILDKNFDPKITNPIHRQ
jgi:hypothetical protein